MNKLSLLKKTTGYFFGVGDNDFFNECEVFYRNFREGDLLNMHLKYIKNAKIYNFIIKNSITFFSGALLFSYFKDKDPYSLPLIPLFETLRYLDNSFFKDRKFLDILKDLERTYPDNEHQTLDEIMQEYDIKKEEEIFGNGEEWKNQ